MKNLNPNPLRFILSALCLSLALLANNAKGQVTSYYFDVNGATAGSGVTDGGTYNWEDPNWSTDSTGDSATGNWVDGGFPVFSAGTDATGSYTITANSGHTIAGMQVLTGILGPGNGVTVNGPGVLSIAAGMQGFIGTNLTINAVLAGTGGFETAGGNIIYLYGTNTFSGGTVLNSGQTYFTNGYAFGTGTLYPVATAFSALLPSGGSPITLTNAFAVTNASGGINFASSANTPVTCTGNWNLQNDLHVRNNGDSTAPLTLSGVLSGPGGLSLSGNNSGTIVLSGANTFTGPVSIPSQSDGNSGGPAFTVYVSSFNSVNGGTPLLASSSLGCPTTIANGTINLCYDSATNILVYTGPGETTDRILAIYGTARGPWIQADGTGPLVFSSNVNVPYGGANPNTKWITLQGANTGYNTIAGVIPNCQTNTSQYQVGVNKDGPGTWVLSGANSFTGPMTIYAGTLIIGGTGQLGSGIYSGAIANSGTFIYASSATQTNSGAMTGTGALIVSNSAANLWLSSTVATTNVIIAAGKLIGNHASPGAFATGTIITFGSSGQSATLDLYGRTTSGIGGLVVAPGATGATIQNGSTGNATLTFTQPSGMGPSTFGGNIIAGPGTGTTTVTVAGGSLTLSGANTFTAGVTVNGASTFALGSDTAAGTGTLNINAANDTIQSADSNTRTLANAITLGQNAYFGAVGTGNLVFNGNVNSGGAAKTLTINNSTTTFNGIISGNGAVNLTKAGSGTLVFGGANTYNKTTVINVGTLALAGSGSISSSIAITVAGGAAFDVSGLTTALTLAATQTLQAGGTGGSSATIATASGKGLTLGASSPLQFTAYDGSTVPLTISGAGSLTIAAGNAVTVTTTTQLGAGSYKLVQIGSGNTTAVTGTPSNPPTVNGSGLVGGGAASLRITSGELWLDVCTTPSATPVVNSPICAGATSVSGTSSEANGTTITVYDNGSPVGAATVTSGAWTATVSAVSSGDSVTATATASGKCVSPASSGVTVTVCKSSVTISRIVLNNNGTVTINYTGGAGASFTLMRSTSLSATRDSWTAVSPDQPATPGSFTITPVTGESYVIRSN
jgi:autotransporter-associated beta strand protein